MEFKVVVHLLKSAFFFVLWGPMMAGLSVITFLLIMPLGLDLEDLSVKIVTLIFMFSYVLGAAISFVVGVVAGAVLRLTNALIVCVIVCEVSMMLTTFIMYSVLDFVDAATFSISISVMPTAICMVLFWKRNKTYGFEHRNFVVSGYE
ncbi:hypothetical protein [Pseudomonas fluorescens]|uniref:hypothetical protein n=1 Tax=Pseudomonas fluorescens TaxID=294 RepID=UPI00123F36B3|nr:hypothetical protein [Pseudomonas fluorescens]